MNIQSFSIVVPNRECINKCPFCVSRMVNSNIYPNLMDISHPHYDINVKEYLKRMRYVADQGCRTLMLTGTSEPQQNKQFLNTFALLHDILGRPFTNIEMQTTGMLLDDPDYLRFLRNFVGVNTMALSISSPCWQENTELIGHPFGEPSRSIDFTKLVKMLKQYDFNIRLCFNLNSYFVFQDVQGFFDACKNKWLADQITFRKLYTSDKDTNQAKWIREHKLKASYLSNLEKFLRKFDLARTTAYGAAVRYVNGMSVVYDTDCMGKNPSLEGTLKYLILRPNCKLYSSWDDPASLVF